MSRRSRAREVALQVLYQDDLNPAMNPGVADAFLQAYREAMQQFPGLIPEPQQADSLLFALLLEKSLYELLYELNNRPTWLHSPLDGLLTLASTPERTL